MCIFPDGLTCLSCSGVPMARHCEEVVTCGEHQVGTSVTTVHFLSLAELGWWGSRRFMKVCLSYTCIMTVSYPHRVPSMP